MQCAILWTLTVEEQEGVDKQRQVIDQRDVEGAVGVNDLWLDTEHVGEVNHPVQPSGV